MNPTQIVSTNKSRIAEIARHTKHKSISSLNHFLTMDWLREAWRLTRKDGATGVDNQTAKEYEKDLEKHLESLLTRMKTGSYRAPLIRRHYIPKTNGGQRPLGIPTIEDKVAQKAIAMILEAVYEQEFYDFSYGFRPRRSCHQALEDMRNEMMDHKAYWILDIDIEKFFDTISHPKLRELLGQRVRDGVIRRLIHKWLKAKILEGGRITKPISGAPQGGVVSPILSNVFLHHALDEWFDKEVRPHLKGYGFMTRFCDDFVMGFQEEADARRVFELLPARLSLFGLKMHTGKSRIVDFRPPPWRITKPELKRYEQKVRKLQTFDYLGFSHTWQRTRKGNWAVFRNTMRSRFVRGVTTLNRWCKYHRHAGVKHQSQRLGQFLRGHYTYYGVVGNYRQLKRFHRAAVLVWRKWLMRRTQKHRMNWASYNRLLKRYPLPMPRIRPPGQVRWNIGH